MLTEEQSRDYETIKKAIQICNPHLSVFQLKPLEGRGNYTYLVNQTLIVRFFKNNFIEDNIQNQNKILTFLKPRVPFQIPTYEIFQESFQNKSLTMTVSPFIAGYQIQANDFRHLPQSPKKFIFEQLSEFLHILHQIPYMEWKHLPILSYTFIRKQVKKRTRGIKIEKHFLNLLPDEKYLTHNDLHPGNFRIDSSYRITGIFDFDTIAYGSKSLDIALFPKYKYTDCCLFKHLYENQTGEKLQNFNTILLLRTLFTLSYVSSNLTNPDMYRLIRTAICKQDKIQNQKHKLELIRTKSD